MTVSRRQAMGLLAGALPALRWPGRASAADALADRARAVPGDARVARGLDGARLVPRREVRDLGALGPAVGAGGRRLVRAADVPAGPRAVRAPREDVRPPVEGRLQGRDPHLEGGGVRPGRADEGVQEGGRALLRDDGRAPRQLRPAGTRSTSRAGTRSRWARSATSCPRSSRPRAPRACASASASTCGSRTSGSRSRATTTTRARSRACRTTAAPRTRPTSTRPAPRSTAT